MVTGDDVTNGATRRGGAEPGGGDGGIGAERAGESVATRFTRLMKATTSPMGMLTDPPIVGIATAVLLVAALAAQRSGSAPTLVTALFVIAALPLTVAIVFFVALTGARGAVIRWLGGLPFPVENLNAVLNGMGEQLEIEFEGAPPLSPDLNQRLDAVTPDAFVTESRDETRSVDVRIGVVDSKRNPARSNHERYARVRALVDGALLPLHRERPIARVRVK